jgi:hypothetical protein
MRIQESESRIQKKNNTIVILAPVFSCFVVPAPGMGVSRRKGHKKPGISLGPSNP